MTNGHLVTAIIQFTDKVMDSGSGPEDTDVYPAEETDILHQPLGSEDMTEHLGENRSTHPYTPSFSPMSCGLHLPAKKMLLRYEVDDI